MRSEPVRNEIVSTIVCPCTGTAVHQISRVQRATITWKFPAATNCTGRPDRKRQRCHEPCLFLITRSFLPRGSSPSKSKLLAMALIPIPTFVGDVAPAKDGALAEFFCELQTFLVRRTTRHGAGCIEKSLALCAERLLQIKQHVRSLLAFFGFSVNVDLLENGGGSLVALRIIST